MVNVLLLMTVAQVTFISFVVLWVTKMDESLQEREDQTGARDRGDS